MDYASEWADRLAVEALDFPDDQRWFVTLTYRDGNLPLRALLVSTRFFPVIVRCLSNVCGLLTLLNRFVIFFPVSMAISAALTII